MAHPSLFPDPLPEGFSWREELLTLEGEAAVLETVRTLPFETVVMHGTEARRRVAHFGGRYGYDRRTLTAGDPMPPWLLLLRTRVAEWTREPADAFSEALVTEYPPGAGIGWHRDAPAFDVVAGISLGTGCRFRLRTGRTGAWTVREVHLPPRSAYVMRGEARSQWQHSIPPVGALRYSITFRTLRSPASRRTRAAPVRTI
jgi:alkylated DNA repair dioxygenase AlkB